MKKIALMVLLLSPVAALTCPVNQTHLAMNCVSTDIPVSATPAIKVMLSGFVLIRFNGCNTPCEIAMPRAIGKHNLNIYVVKLQRGKGPEMIYSYWGPLKDALWLGVYRPKYPGIRRFIAESFSPARADPHDFGWAIDLEGPEYHNALLQWDQEQLTPPIYITNGLFYADRITDATATSITRLGPGGKKEPNYRMVATRIAANIDFDDNLSLNPIKGFATLRFGNEAQPLLKLDSDPTGAIRYEIHIENEPLDPAHVMASDFPDYYGLLKGNQNISLYDFAFPGRATDRLPCMPAVFGGQ
ncbi:MAG: hypothetical protein ACJ74G_01895 [Blastocatellia bacterium]